jgi:hypothetical protein
MWTTSSRLVFEFVDGRHQVDIAFPDEVEELQPAIGVRPRRRGADGLHLLLALAVALFWAHENQSNINLDRARKMFLFCSVKS